MATKKAKMPVGIIDYEGEGRVYYTEASFKQGIIEAFEEVRWGDEPLIINLKTGDVQRFRVTEPEDLPLETVGTVCAVK